MTEIHAADDPLKETFSDKLESDQAKVERKLGVEDSLSMALTWLNSVEVAHNDQVDDLENQGRPSGLEGREASQKAAEVINYLRQQISTLSSPKDEIYDPGLSEEERNSERFSRFAEAEPVANLLADLEQSVLVHHPLDTAPLPFTTDEEHAQLGERKRQSYRRKQLDTLVDLSKLSNSSEG